MSKDGRSRETCEKNYSLEEAINMVTGESGCCSPLIESEESNIQKEPRRIPSNENVNGQSERVSNDIVPVENGGVDKNELNDDLCQTQCEQSVDFGAPVSNTNEETGDLGLTLEDANFVCEETFSTIDNVNDMMT